MFEQHQQQNESWWKAKVEENDAERTKLKQAWVRKIKCIADRF